MKAFITLAGEGILLPAEHVPALINLLALGQPARRQSDYATKLTFTAPRVTDTTNIELLPDDTVVQPVPSPLGTETA